MRPDPGPKSGIKWTGSTDLNQSFPHLIISTTLASPFFSCRNYINANEGFVPIRFLIKLK